MQQILGRLIAIANMLQYPLAFEVSLDPECSALQLTLIAQSSCVDEPQAIRLLDQFEQTLHATLKEVGRNIISTNVAPTNGVNSNGHTIAYLSSTGVSKLDGKGAQCGRFIWTKEAIQIRQEVALLADIEERKVNETSSIFGLGLDSIDVIKLSSRLSKRGIVIPVSAIIKSQTIENISTNMSGSGKRTQHTSIGNTIQQISRDLTRYLKDNKTLPDDAEAVLPATPLQQSMVNEMIKSDYRRYFTVEAFEIDGKVDDLRLLLAVEQTIRMSPILRTTFIEIDDPRSPVSYAQVVRTGFFHSSDVSKESSLEGYLDRFKSESAALAASNQALCHVKCVSVGHIRYLIMAISHALYDGMSLRAIHEDIRRNYEKKLFSRPDSLPYLDMVFQSTTDDAKRFWRSALSNLPAASFPTKEPSDLTDPNVVHRVESHSRVSLKDIEVFCRSSRITLQTLGQTCWAIVLSHLMGQLDVVFGSVLSCRDSQEAEEIMFPLMNTVVVRSVLHGTVSEMLRYMQDMSNTTRQYQHFPLGTAQAYALASRESGFSTKDTTLVDTLFIYQGRRQPREADLLYKSVYGSSDVEFPVCVEMEIVNDKHLSWTTACKSIVRNATETKEIIVYLDSVLQCIITTPKAPIIVSDADDISVCGLPKFRKAESTQSNSATPARQISDQEWSDVELKIRGVLHEISDVPLDGIHKDSTIFHLGLDSILVLKLPALLRQHGIKLSVSSILKDQTVRAMAQSILCADSDTQESLNVDQTLSNAMSSLDVSSVVESLEKEIGEVRFVLPATAGQQYMIRSWQTSQGALFYPTFEYTLSGTVDKAKLSNAWSSLLRKHDILRTGFIEIGSDLIQVAFKDSYNELVYQAHERRPDRKNLSDLRTPPVALVLEETKGSTTKVKLEIHHALYDGISLLQLIDHLQSLYQGQALPAQEFSFRTFVARLIAASKKSQRQSSGSAKSITQSKWESYIKHETVHPFRSVNGTSTVSHNKRTEVFYPALKIAPLRNVAQESGVSVDALLLAAISQIYAQRLGQGNAASTVSQVVFGIYLANRAPFGVDLTGLAAPTLNLLPLCVRDPLGRNLSEIAKDIQRDLQNISSAEMSCASLAEIYKWCGVRVNFFVNILKDTTPEAVASNGANGAKDGDDLIFEPRQDLSKRAKVVDAHYNENFEKDARHEAYLVRLLLPCISLRFNLLTPFSPQWMSRSDIRGPLWI